MRENHCFVRKLLKIFTTGSLIFILLGTAHAEPTKLTVCKELIAGTPGLQQVLNSEKSKLDQVAAGLGLDVSHITIEVVREGSPLFLAQKNRLIVPTHEVRGREAKIFDAKAFRIFLNHEFGHVIFDLWMKMHSANYHKLLAEIDQISEAYKPLKAERERAHAEGNEKRAGTLNGEIVKIDYRRTMVESALRAARAYNEFFSDLLPTLLLSDPCAIDFEVDNQALSAQQAFDRKWRNFSPNFSEQDLTDWMNHERTVWSLIVPLRHKVGLIFPLTDDDLVLKLKIVLTGITEFFESTLGPLMRAQGAVRWSLVNEALFKKIQEVAQRPR